MLTLVIGGAASGKSAYAESLTLKFPLPRYYVATMQVWDEECAKRVEKHRAMRKEKQFETIESPISLDKIRIPNRGIVLLEDLGNLTANELYDPKGAGVNTAEAVLYGVEILYKQCEHLIVVGNEVFSGGAAYADETDLYLKALAQIQNGIAARADHVCRVVCGIPVYYKGGGKVGRFCRRLPWRSLCFRRFQCHSSNGAKRTCDTRCAHSRSSVQCAAGCGA